MADCIITRRGGFSDNVAAIPYINTRANTINIESGTSITSSVSAEKGEIVLALVMFRQEAEMVTPDGWTKIVESNDFIDIDLHNKLAWFKYACLANEIVEVTFSQANANRMQLILVTVKNANDAIYDNAFDVYVNNSTVTGDDKEWVDIPKKQNGEFMLYGATSALWLNSTQTDTYEDPENSHGSYGSWEVQNHKLNVIQYNIRNAYQPRLCLIDNIVGNEQYKLRTTHLLDGNQFALLGVKII